ncbi:hypothetical protein [Rodentibacter ratti]|uniref:hypothetical protein n=1 Tax=Rodentibacter ratti TaxID=1906745 RepID=UPI0015D66EDF|nr:hypothetical protein [Rodentibacter ratti]
MNNYSDRKERMSANGNHPNLAAKLRLPLTDPFLVSLFILKLRLSRRWWMLVI